MITLLFLHPKKALSDRISELVRREVDGTS
jgi:hypothetical protein